MFNILYLPLDDRPCNEQFPFLFPKKDYSILELPENLLGNRKEPANFEIISKFLLENASKCNAFILSLDTLIYGGLIPSRIHNTNEDELIKRIDVIRESKKINPKLKIYAFLTIMRCPNTNFDSEEPTYWTEYGKLIFRYGQLKDLTNLNKISKSEIDEFNNIKNTIPENIITDFSNRRKNNLELTKKILRAYKEEDIFDYICLPQDDSHAIGWTATDQKEIKNYLNQIDLKNIEIYPGADEVGMVILSRVLSEFYGKMHKIYIYYPLKDAKNMIPPYEDRPIDLTLKSQIKVSNSIEVDNENEADIVLCACIGDYDRNKLISYIQDQKKKNKIVGIVDTFLPSGSDELLIKCLREEKYFLSIDGYASWNTASNSFGTVLAETKIYELTSDKKGNLQFLIHRYVDDLTYCTYVRTWTDINAALARGYCEAKLDGRNGTCVAMCREEMLRYININYPEVYEFIKDIHVSCPWNRSFEMKFNIDYRGELL